MQTAEVSRSECARTAEAIESDYPAPPELNIPSWSRNITADGAVTAPRLVSQLESPTLCKPPSPDLPTEVEHGRPPLASSARGGNRTNGDFYRRASWAPDGSVLLAITESQRNHILRCIAPTREPTSARSGGSTGGMERVCEQKSPSPLLDAVWYPMPAVEQPEEHADQEEIVAKTSSTVTWCFAESLRDLPIRLTASNSGQARASYAIMNHVERFVGPHSLAFSTDLSRLYCGLWSALAVFPLSRPGLNSHASIPLVSGKRSHGGQRGIISALATAAHSSDPSHDIVAVGTFGGSVGIYDFDPSAFPEPTEHTAKAEHESLAQSSCLAGWSEIEGDGITQLKFHPLSPSVLFVASRRSDYIYVYDIRYLFGDTARWSFHPLAQAAAGLRSAHLLAKLRRPGGASAQRLYFDVDWAGRWLATGDDQGYVHFWRIDTGRFTDGENGQDAAEEPGAAELAPDLSWRAHADAVGSVSFHPYRPWLLTVSGSRHWPENEHSSSSDSGSESEGDSGSASEATEASGHFRAWHTWDSSLKIWDFSDPEAS